MNTFKERVHMKHRDVRFGKQIFWLDSAVGITGWPSPVSYKEFFLIGFFRWCSKIIPFMLLRIYIKVTGFQGVIRH